MSSSLHAPSKERLLALQHHTCAVTALAVSPDTEWIASGSKDGTIILRKASNPSINAQMPASDSKKSPVDALAFPPDGTRLASALENGLVQVWSIEYSGNGGKPVNFSGLKHEFTCSAGSIWFAMAWYPDQKKIVACAEGGAVWYLDLTKNQADFWRLSTEYDDAALTCALFSSDASLLVLGGANGFFHIWNVHLRTLQANIPVHNPKHPILAAVFDARSRYPKVMTYASDGIVRVFAYREEFLTEQFSISDGDPDPLGSEFLSQEGDMLASNTDKTFYWEHVQPSKHFAERYFLGEQGLAPVNSVRFSLNGHFLASASSDGTIRVSHLEALWDPTCDPFAALKLVSTEHKGEGTLVVFAQHGDVLVSAGDDGKVRIRPNPHRKPEHDDGYAGVYVGQYLYTD